MSEDGNETTFFHFEYKSHVLTTIFPELQWHSVPHSVYSDAVKRHIECDIVFGGLWN